MCWWFVYFMFWNSVLWIAARTSLLLVWLPCHLSTFSRLTGYPKFRGRNSLALHGCITPSWMVSSSLLGFAIGEPSLEVASWPSFDMALCLPIGSEKMLRWQKEKTIKFMMFNKRWRWLLSSRPKLSLVCMSAIDFWCQHIWFGSLVRKWFCRTISQAQFCGFWTRVSLLDFVVFDNVQLRLVLRRMFVGGCVIHIWQLLNLSLSFFSWSLGPLFHWWNGLLSRTSLLGLGYFVLQCCLLISTLQLLRPKVESK